VVENFTSGVILLLERPVREGDWIEVGPYSGIVRKISVRSTRIETFDRHQIIVPNSKLITESVKNLSFAGDAARIILPIGVAYDTDLDRAREVLLDIAAKSELVLDDPAPSVAVEDFGDSSINLKLLAFVRDVTTGAGAKSDLSFAIAKRFAAEGIEIPFPQRTVTLRDERGPTGDVRPAIT
jgi:small-conductance mechanosensitive channel